MSKRSSSRKSNFPYPFAFESNYWTEFQEYNEDVSDLELSKADQDNLCSRGYKTGKFLGKGKFGKAYRATCYKMPCVVKAIDKEGVEINELYMLKHVKHPHVVLQFDLYVTVDHRLLIFMELLQGGSMNDYLKELKKSDRFLSEGQVRHYYLQISDALRYMHGLGFAHRDLHEGNILLDGTKRVCKISDFGLSDLIYKPTTGLEMFRHYIRGDINDLGDLLQRMLKNNWSWEVCQLIMAHRGEDLDEILRDKLWLTMAL